MPIKHLFRDCFFLLLALLPFTAFASYSYTKLDQKNQSELGSYIMELNAAQASESDTYSQNLWPRLRKNLIMTEVNPELVTRFENYYASKPEYFNRIVKRGSPYLYHILNEVEKRNMPTEVALLPMIESAFVTKATSHVGAQGIWQFMPATGRQYGLKQTHWYDGRNDIYAATTAALDYLEYLHNMFQDWPLAFAAYNAGENRVARAMARAEQQGLEPTFENIKLPTETRQYVPKLLAVRNLIQNPASYNIQLQQITNQPYFETVTLKQPLDIKAIARLANITETEVLTLNPAHKIPVWVPSGNKKLLLPKHSVAAFQKNLKQADPNSLLSWQLFKINQSQHIEEIAQITYSKINDLRKVNRLSSDYVPSGSVLLIPKNRDELATVIDTVIDHRNTRPSEYFLKASGTDAGTDVGLSPVNDWVDNIPVINTPKKKKPAVKKVTQKKPKAKTQKGKNSKVKAKPKAKNKKTPVKANKKTKKPAKTKKKSK